MVSIVYIYYYAYLSTYVKYFGGETTREEMVLGAKRLGSKIEAKRLRGKRPGGNILGAKRLVTVQVRCIHREKTIQF